MESLAALAWNGWPEWRGIRIPFSSSPLFHSQRAFPSSQNLSSSLAKDQF
jgi:hypothetical protein